MTAGKPTPIRLDDKLLARLDRVAQALAERAGGVQVARASAIRLAVERGLDVLEEEFDVVRPKKTKR